MPGRPENNRAEKMTLRLNAEEVHLREKLAEHFGINDAGVLRMGLHELARRTGITIPPEKPPAPNKKNPSSVKGNESKL